MPQVELRVIATANGQVTVHWPTKMPPVEARKILHHAIMGMDQHEAQAGKGLLVAAPSGMSLDQIVKKAG